MNSDQNSTYDAGHSSVLASDQDSVMIRNQNVSANSNEINPQNNAISFHSQYIPCGTPQTSHWDKLTCRHCFKKFDRRDKLKRHTLRVHKQGLSGDPFPCAYCDESYLQKKLLQAHYKAKHKVKGNDSLLKESKDTAVQQSDKGRIKCIECSIKFPTLKKLRLHLRNGHQLDMIEKKISFPNMKAFMKWKLDLERRESTYFYNGRGPFKGRNYLQRVYLCNRSGMPQVHSTSREGRRRINNLIGSQKTGIICTAAMRVMIYPDEVEVEYCLQHYGHGKELTFIQLTAEEQDAVQENVSNGIPLQEQLNDIKHSKSLAEHFKAWTIKKRDSRFISCAFTSENYNAEISISQSFEQWVRTCSNMEESPVLLYKQEELKNKSEDFLLIIMTEFQKHVLLASTKQVVCLDTFCQFKSGRHYFTVLMVMDDQEMAFPVAFCLSKKLNRSIILQFLSSVKESTGPLSCSYFMSNDNKISYEAWREIMQDKPTWVWSIWSFEDKVRKYMNSLLKDIPKREATYRILRTIMECNSQPVFATMLKNFKKSLLDNEKSEYFGKSFDLHFGSNTEKWACCYRKDLKLSTNIYLEFLHKTLKFCFRTCFKKRLDTFLFVLMKWLRYKMLDRLCNMLDEEKIDLAKTSISGYHDMGLEIECRNIISLSGQIWLIQSENEADVYVTQEFKSCPEMCDLKCHDCNICVHMYSCSCVQSLINANICQHIHAVVWKFLTPYFSPPDSPAQDTYNDTCNVSDNAVIPNVSDNIFEKVQSVYKQLQINKNKLNKNSLSEINIMLNKCRQICSSDEIPEKFSSKSTQTEHIAVLSSSHVINGLPNIMSNSTSENCESSSFVPVATPIFNNVNISASEENENILVSNNASEIRKNFNSKPIVLSDSTSVSKHTNKRRCFEKKTVQGISSINDVSNNSVIPVTNASVMTTHDPADSKLNCVPQTSVTNSVPLSNSQAVMSPLSPEKSYLIKCTAPIIRKSKIYIKTSSCSKSNGGRKATNRKKLSTVKAPIPSILTDNQANSPELFWDSVSKKYFVVKDNLSLATKSDHTQIQLSPASESLSVSSPEDDSDVCDGKLEKSTISHSPFVVNTSKASTSTPNHPSNFVSHNPIIVRASIVSDKS